MFTRTLLLTTAALVVLRGGERPRFVFRPFSIAGCVLVVRFEAFQSTGPSQAGDL